MAESSVELAAIEVEAANFNCEDCLLSFDKESKVVITDNFGHVIFYNENVQNLDISSWSHGSYVVKVNDKETFEFSI